MSYEHVDVLIVGAGLSGIGAACHLQASCPGKSYAILEARDRIGGTWDLFRYPGIRSDSDMYTLGYSFRPWRDDQLDRRRRRRSSTTCDETAREHAIEQKIRFDHRVVRGEWSSEDARWTVEASRGDTSETVRITASFLFMCSGYYRYDEGYTPDFPGTERFAGRIVHPQHWPEDLDYAGKRVVVIGSGATAVTLVPAMARDAAHVTMLQRSPSYIVSLPAEDPIAKRLRRMLPAKLAYPIVRWKNVLLTMAIFQLSRRRPGLMQQAGPQGRGTPAARGLRHRHALQAPATTRGTSACAWCPTAICSRRSATGRASVVTDQIETFTESGIRLKSGTELEADVIVTATGLNLLALGGIEMVVDGARGRSCRRR